MPYKYQSADITYSRFKKMVTSIDEFDDFILYTRKMREVIPKLSNNRKSSALLDAIWNMKQNPIAGIKKATNCTNVALNEAFGIPLRTVEDWARGATKCPRYTSTMMAYIAFGDANLLF